MWENCVKVHRISMLEGQEFGVRQRQKILTEVSGALIHANVH